jgi:hypothetical protein
MKYVNCTEETAIKETKKLLSMSHYDSYVYIIEPLRFLKSDANGRKALCVMNCVSDIRYVYNVKRWCRLLIIQVCVRANVRFRDDHFIQGDSL